MEQRLLNYYLQEGNNIITRMILAVKNVLTPLPPFLKHQVEYGD